MKKNIKQIGLFICATILKQTALVQKNLFCIFIAIGLLVTSTISWGGYAVKAIDHRGEPDFGSALYRESFEDMGVKVMGGHVRVKRIWQDTHWIFFPNWQDLTFEYEKIYTQQVQPSVSSTGGSSSTGSIKVGEGEDPYTLGELQLIKRGDFRYEKVAGGNSDETLFKFDENKIITKHSTGYTWRDRRGNSINYDADGKILKYTNRNGVVVSFTRNADGKIHEVKDHLGNVILTMSYTGEDKIHEITDYSGRKVTYHWDGGDLKRITDLRGYDWSYDYESKLGFRVMKSKTSPSDPSETQFSNGRKTLINHQIIKGGMQCIATQRSTGDEGVFAVSESTGGGGSIAKMNDCVTVSVPDTLILRSIKDADGLGVTYDYFYDGQAKTYTLIETWPGGKRNETIINLNGETSAKWTNNIRTSQTINDGNKHTHIDEMGLKTIREYDQWDNLLKVTYPDQTSESWQYNNYSQVKIHTDINGVQTEYMYDDKGNLDKKIEAKGTGLERTTEYEYDEYGNSTQIKHVGDANTAESTRIYTYDNYGNIQTYKNGEGKTTQYQNYDAMGNAELIIDPEQNQWRYSYDAAGNLTNSYSPLGWQADPKVGVSYQYYNDGSLKQVTNADNETTKYTYDIRGRTHTITDALSNIATIERNYKGQVLSYFDADGHKAHMTYDSLGRVSTIVDGHGDTITLNYSNDGSKPQMRPDFIQYPTFKREFIYDDRKRVKQILDTPNGGSTKLTATFTYTISGQRETVTDAEQNKTEYRYDKLGRLEKIIDAHLKETIFSYDSRDNLLSVTDPQSSTTQYQYDRDNRQLKEIRPLGQEYEFIYDDRGNLDYMTDPMGNKIDYQYDADGHLVIQTIFNHSDLQNAERIINYNYYIDGLLQSYDDGITNATYQYTDTNRLQQEEIDFGPFSKSYSYSYYKNGDLKTYTDAESQTITYTYDNNRQLQLVQIPNVGSYSVNSYKWFAPEQVNYPGGSIQTKNYNNLMQLEGIEVKDPAQNIKMNYGYTYDEVGNIDSKSTEHGNYKYNYDELYRLIEAVNPSNTESFTYDKVGNRKTTQVSQAPWNYNGNHELESRPNITYQYDDNGSTTQITKAGQNTTLIYNGSNRLSEVKDHSGATVATYYYDPFGRRLSKDVSGTKTYFMYTPQGLSGEYTESGSLIRGYGYKPGGHWTTDPLYLKTGNTRDKYYFYQNDHLGTPQKLMSTTGAIVWSAKYEAFGKANIDINLVENPLRFAGQYEDQETGFHQNRYRYYSPELGRYVTQDPIGLAGGINPFVYVYDNPLFDTDSWGLFNDGTKYGPEISPHRGHSDFYGSDRFDYVRYDHQGDTNPVYGDPAMHFRERNKAIRDEIEAAINSCNKEDFEDVMHQYQDTFSHWDQGYRWDPYGSILEGSSNEWLEMRRRQEQEMEDNWQYYFPKPYKMDKRLKLPCAGWGHLCDMTVDQNMQKWDLANKGTELWVKEWDKKCPNYNYGACDYKETYEPTDYTTLPW